jgi:hypothetical protein
MSVCPSAISASTIPPPDIFFYIYAQTPELLPLPLSAPISIIFPQLLTLGLFCVEYKDSKIISKLCLLVKRPCLLAPSPPPSPHIFMGPAGPKPNTRASSFTLASPPPNLYTCTPW